jgi:hypothetical protein
MTTLAIRHSIKVSDFIILLPQVKQQTYDKVARDDAQPLISNCFVTFGFSALFVIAPLRLVERNGLMLKPARENFGRVCRRGQPACFRRWGITLESSRAGAAAPADRAAGDSTGLCRRLTFRGNQSRMNGRSF